MICARCDEPILPGEPYETRPIMTNSGPGITIYLHPELCVTPPHQTAPDRPTAAIRGA